MIFVLVWLVGLVLFVTLRVWTTRPSAAG